MLLQNGWRQMTHDERRLLGNVALEYQFICPNDWDVERTTHLDDLKNAKTMELERDKSRVQELGGRWVEIKK